jgi:hypothetical protein
MVAIAGAGALNTDRWVQPNSSRTSAAFDSGRAQGFATDAAVPATTVAPSAFVVPVNTFEFVQSRSVYVPDQAQSAVSGATASGTVDTDSDDVQALSDAMDSAVDSIADVGADPVAASAQLTATPDGVTLTSIAVGIIPADGGSTSRTLPGESRATPSVAVDS